jgi:3-oxoadipate enol-lactonase
MERATLDGADVAFEIRGDGEPVVFVHHGAGVDWFEPLTREPALSGRHRLIRYHRAGYGASSPLNPPLTFAREAATFEALIRRLGLDSANVVGHSASACIALQIALSVPHCVRSLALLEPALLAVPSPPDVPRAVELFRAGDTAGAVDTFLAATCGAEARAVLERALPGAVAQAQTDAATFFGHELPALRRWTFGADDARRVTQPTLAVVGERSDQRFHQRHALLLEWLPHVEPFVLAGAGHLLHLQNGRDVAEALAAFFARHSAADANV